MKHPSFQHFSNFLRIIFIPSIMRYLILILSVTSLIMAVKMVTGIRFRMCSIFIFLFISSNSFENRSISWQSYYVYYCSMECSKSKRFSRAKFMHASHLIIWYVGYAVLNKILAYSFSGYYFDNFFSCLLRIVPWDERTGRYESRLYMNVTEIRQQYAHLRVNDDSTNSFQLPRFIFFFFGCVDFFGNQSIK